MSFKLFSDNQMLSFEKFYINNELYTADSFEYSSKRDEDLSFFESSNFVKLRNNDLNHFYYVRNPIYNKESKLWETAAYEALHGFQKDTPVVNSFNISDNFFRNDKKSFDYNGFGDFSFKNHLFNSGFFFNSNHLK